MNEALLLVTQAVQHSADITIFRVLFAGRETSAYVVRALVSQGLGVRSCLQGMMLVGVQGTSEEALTCCYRWTSDDAAWFTYTEHTETD